MAAAVMRYGDKMLLDDSGSAGWQGVSGIGLLEGDCFATLLHGRFVFCRNFTRRLGITRGIMDAKRGLEGHHQNQWKVAAWDVAQSEFQTADRMLFNNKILIASKVR